MSILRKTGAGMALGLVLALAPAAHADEPAPAAADGVPVVPATRDDLKRALEASKHNEPRLPLPPPTEEERARAAAGDPWALANNGRMRRHYLPAGVLMGGFTREPDPKMTLGYPFQTRLFWIVSRANNCTYCMGHQESKLSAVGLDDDQIAALDGDWAVFTPAERAAFAFARRLTHEPHAIADADVDALRSHYTDDQILEMIVVLGNFNAMNRWTGALRIPQEGHREYLTPTSEAFRGLASRIAPLPAGSEGPSCAPPADRGPLPTRAEVEAALAACRDRAPRIPPAGPDEARAAPPEGAPDAGPAHWVRLLARFPVAGTARIAMHEASWREGELDDRLRAEIAWVAARHDRAWYALGHARRRLAALGFSDDAIFALDAPADGRDPGEQAVLDLARKLTVDPARIADADIAGLQAHFPDRQVAEIVFQVTEAAFFNRLTEAAGLPLEADEPAPR